ncbi:MAG: 4-phosphoerythronate dehydrogenase [Bacteroidales bacterium]|nr:4-phosphoerythronate dehydrogenase [Bacteroidales bacterium]
MKHGLIIADRDIPFLAGVLENWFDVRYLPGREIGPEDVSRAAALVVRTRTRCNSFLLEGSSVKLVATATIGTDHIDTDYCAVSGIAVASAPGCNSAAVAQYVSTALRALALDRPGATLGVIGAGHVGTKVAARARAVGMRVLLNDPPREAAEGPEGFTPLTDLLAQSDIVTVHIPLWRENRDFADEAFFASMKPGASFINASRGEVVDEAALLAARPRLGRLVLDVWKNEPAINRDLLAAADIATPHIAGYSIQGKINGTQAVVRAVGDFFDVPQLRNFFVRDVELPQIPYDIFADDAALRSHPENFERLRSNYSYRNDQLQ